MLKKIYPIYFAVFPLLSFYAGNKKELRLDALFIPIILSLVVTFLVFIIAKLITKEDKKANIITLIFLLYFFSYGDLIKNFKNVNQFFLFILYTLFAIFIAKFLLRLKNNPHLPVFFTIIGAYLMVWSLYGIVPYEIQRYQAGFNLHPSAEQNLKPVKKADAPDIYYIIFDRYANSSILKNQYNFDNGPFIDFLKSRGFYVAENSFANYPRTYLSLASSLNLDYLDDLVKRIGESATDYTPVFDMVKDNKVGRFLKSSGYRYIYFGDWWTPTQANYLADENINLYANSNEFLRKFAKTTIFSHLVGDYWKGNKLFGIFQDRIYENTNYKFEKFDTVASKKSPKFIFAHMLFPHHPYLFDKKCKKVDPKRSEPEEKKYLEQLQCANTKIMKMVDTILKNSKKPPIIILQSDEGPYKTDEMNLDGAGVDWTKVSDEAIFRHVKILNAYHLPGFDNKKLYQSITPVNSFRLILNHYFGQSLEKLPDKSYFIPDINHPYKYTEITDKVKSQ